MYEDILQMKEDRLCHIRLWFVLVLPQKKQQQNPSSYRLVQNSSKALLKDSIKASSVEHVQGLQLEDSLCPYIACWNND